MSPVRQVSFHDEFRAAPLKQTITILCFSAAVSSMALSAQSSPDIAGVYFGVAGLKDLRGLEVAVGVPGSCGGAPASVALRLLKVQGENSPQTSIKFGMGPYDERWFIHPGLIVARDPRFGGQIGIGLWGTAIPTQHLYLSVSLEALKSKGFTDRQAVFSLGYHL
jgi:hypothetical protein